MGPEDNEDDGVLDALAPHGHASTAAGNIKAPLAPDGGADRLRVEYGDVGVSRRFTGAIDHGTVLDQ